MISTKEEEIKKTEEIIKKEASCKFELVGEIIQDGLNRGFTQDQVIQLIITGVIRL